jgi:hypothetical protein
MSQKHGTTSWRHWKGEKGELATMKIHLHPFNPATPFISLNPHARILLNPLANNASR